MLLNQTSGLPDYVEFDDAAAWAKGVAQDVVLTAIFKPSLQFTPGSAYAYSSSNYFVLGAVVQSVARTSYADYLAGHIFQPLGLNHTSYATPPAAQTTLPYTTTRPLVAGTKGLADGIALDPSFLSGAGALWSTGEDLAAWDAALLGGAVVPADRLALALTPPASIPDFQSGAPTSYGMGWVRGTSTGHPLTWHNGKTYAYTAFNGMLLDDGLSLSILANVDLQENPALYAFAQNLLQSICRGQGTAANC